MKVALKIKGDLANMSILRQKNTSLQEKMKELLKEIMSLKKEKDEGSLISKGLDEKLSKALARAELVPAMEIEKKELEAQLKNVEKTSNQYREADEKKAK